MTPTQACSLARAGDSAEVSLQGLQDVTALTPGTVLCHPAYPVPLVCKVRLSVAWEALLSVLVLAGVQRLRSLFQGSPAHMRMLAATSRAPHPSTHPSTPHPLRTYGHSLRRAC